jgi:hypothetical protein
MDAKFSMEIFKMDNGKGSFTYRTSSKYTLKVCNTSVEHQYFNLN